MTAKKISAFCMGISMLLDAGVALDEGVYSMADDADDKEEKELLLKIAEQLELGTSFAEALHMTKAFPEYMVSMSRVGQETGTLDVVMRSLADYYAKESQLAKSIKSALSYPILMVFVLVLVFFVLLTKVMPIFEEIYEQVGTKLSDAAKTAIDIGGIISGALVVIIIIAAIIATLVSFISRRGHSVSWAENLTSFIMERSIVALAVSKRRFAAAMALTVRSGLDYSKGLELAEKLMTQKKASQMAQKCRDIFSEKHDLYESIKESGIFTGMDLQMVKVGAKAGRIDITMEQLSFHYEQQADDAIDNLVGRFEPTIVAVLAVVVGLVLFSVMMPLVGIMSSIG